MAKDARRTSVSQARKDWNRDPLTWHREAQRMTLERLLPDPIHGGIPKSRMSDSLA
ncbi:hypothetical protein LC612_35075 [Nostoc sp. CHAB 5834]|nr:hypothetical protein [Nostoc sp. CHAB 5834]